MLQKQPQETKLDLTFAMQSSTVSFIVRNASREQGHMTSHCNALSFSYVYYFRVHKNDFIHRLAMMQL